MLLMCTRIVRLGSLSRRCEAAVGARQRQVAHGEGVSICEPEGDELVLSPERSVDDHAVAALEAFDDFLVHRLESRRVGEHAAGVAVADRETRSPSISGASAAHVKRRVATRRERIDLERVVEQMRLAGHELVPANTAVAFEHHEHRVVAGQGVADLGGRVDVERFARLAQAAGGLPCGRSRRR